MSSFPVQRATRRTFYLERYPARWEVVRVWEAGSAVDPSEVQQAIDRVFATSPDERWLAEQADAGLSHAPWHAVALEPAGESWRVVRAYPPHAELHQDDRARVLAVAALIIPRPSRGHAGVRFLARDPSIALEATHSAQHLLRGDLPRDAGA